MSRRRVLLSRAGLAIAGWVVLLVACTVEPDAPGDPAATAATADPLFFEGTVDVAQPPSGSGAMAPQLSATRDGSVLLSWLEPEGEGHQLRMATWDGGGWSEATTVASGDDFFANWADVPSVVEDGRGQLYAHWLRALGSETYAYGVELARSPDGGASWQPLGLLHDDRSATEHGFVTLVPAPGAGVDAVWLDGRGMTEGGPMTLRTRRVAGDGGVQPAPLAAETVIDEQVCDCCSTAAVQTAGGLVVAYRDRSGEEVRDISILRRADSAWSVPRPLHRDGWTIPGCPVNGPALATDGTEIVAAWFTAAEGTPRVFAARSPDAGASWSEPVEIDGDSPLGRVGVALAADGDAVVSWLAADGGVRLRRVDPDGRAGRPVLLAVTATTRASGVPRLVVAAGRLHVVWVEATGEEPRRLRFARLAADEVPS